MVLLQAIGAILVTVGFLQIASAVMPFVLVGLAAVAAYGTYIFLRRDGLSGLDLTGLSETVFNIGGAALVGVAVYSVAAELLLGASLLVTGLVVGAVALFGFSAVQEFIQEQI